MDGVPRRGPIKPRAKGSELRAVFADALPETGLGEDAFDFDELLDASRAQNGRFLAYVMGSAEPVGVLGELLAAALNQNVTSWRSGPAATTIERALVESLARALGCDGFGGSFCGGGSAANLMGLAMARESRCPANESGARPGIVYTSSEVHMSVPKAVALLGLGRTNLRLIPVDAQFRMRTDALRAAIAADVAAGSTPVAVVATVGTISTGAIDPLDEIAGIAREHDLYLLSTARTAASPHSQSPSGSGRSASRTRSRSTVTSGCTSSWTAGSCSSATATSRAAPSATRTTTSHRTRPTHSRPTCSSRSRWSCRGAFGH